MDTAARVTAMSAIESVDRKTNLFFLRHIVPNLDPENIHWHFSLSGGKDSFVMAHAVRNWYLRERAQFHASGFTIDQWGGAATRSIAAQFDWIDVSVTDAKALTLERTDYRPGQQAPCRSCSDVRHDVTDAVMSRSRDGRRKVVDVVARGLHLSDTAISLLWRHAAGRNSFDDLWASGKGRPVVELSEGKFLAKPLAYVREFESSQYAAEMGFAHACCGCPACRFPSRRDIVEESLRDFFSGPTWEFDVPGVSKLMSHLGAKGVSDLSTGGREPKHKHLPSAFADFMVDRFYSNWRHSKRRCSSEFDESQDLDHIGTRRLMIDTPLIQSSQIPMPSLLSGREVSALERKMISTLGPFWGQLGLAAELRMKVAKVEHEVFGFTKDDKWTHVNHWLTEFYGTRASYVEMPLRFARSVHPA